MSTKVATPYVDREAIHAKLMLLSTVAEKLESSSGDFDENAHYALAVMLSEVARNVYPECYDDKRGTA